MVLKRLWIFWFAICSIIGACARREASGELSRAAPAKPVLSTIAPASDDALTAELRSSDDTVRYRAAARAFQDFESSNVSVNARNALFDILENAKEPEGVRLWAARAVAKHEPERALRQFVALSSAGRVVDGDAWILLGPRALPALMSQCKADCPDPTFTEITIIVGNSPSHEDSRNAIPLLLREGARSEQRRALAYRALGAFGPSLVPELEALRNHDDPAMRKAASEALAAVRDNP
jgi:hypothetical protein